MVGLGVLGGEFPSRFLGTIPRLDRSDRAVRLAAMTIVKDRTSRAELATLAEQQFGDLVKAVVDIKRGIMAVGGELHSDEESLLLEDGSEQQDLWGINLYPATAGADWIEFDSMINIRPAHGNRSRGVDDPEARRAIAALVDRLVVG